MPPCDTNEGAQATKNIILHDINFCLMACNYTPGSKMNKMHIDFHTPAKCAYIFELMGKLLKSLFVLHVYQNIT
jgi:hypothetical protein